LLRVAERQPDPWLDLFILSPSVQLFWYIQEAGGDPFLSGPFSTWIGSVGHPRDLPLNLLNLPNSPNSSL